MVLVIGWVYSLCYQGIWQGVEIYERFWMMENVRR